RLQLSLRCRYRADGVARPHLSVSACGSLQALWRIYNEFVNCHPFNQLRLLGTDCASDLLHREASIWSSSRVVVGMVCRFVPLRLVLGYQMGMGNQFGYAAPCMCVSREHAHGGRSAGEQIDLGVRAG